MSGVDFVRGLEVSRDPALRRLRPDLRVPGEDLVRGTVEALRGGGEPPEAIGAKLRAAVDAGSVLSFVSGVTAEDKSDVLFSTQLAQRAASARHDRYEATEDWYRVYAEVLEHLGWVGEGFAFTQRGSSSGEFRMEKSALDVIATIATGAQLAILVKALDTMRNLAEEDGAIRVFELQAVAELSGNFQLGAVQRAENGALSLALGAFRFRSKDNRRRVLFWKWGAAEIEFWTAAQKMTLNAELYAPLRRVVVEKLGEEAADYVVDLEVK
jgi:hypothetical protein